MGARSSREEVQLRCEEPATINVCFKEYWLTVSLTPGCGLGLIVRPAVDHTELTVTRIADGPISMWNGANPNSRVRQGDSILEVNGIRGDTSAMIASFRRGPSVKMLLRREGEYVVLLEQPPEDIRFSFTAGCPVMGLSSMLDTLVKHWNTCNERLQVRGSDRITALESFRHEEGSLMQLQIRRELQWLVENMPCMPGSSCKATECMICLSDFEADTVVKQMPCGHAFCAGCIDQWVLLYGGGDCPLCRAYLGNQADGNAARDAPT